MDSHIARKVVRSFQQPASSEEDELNSLSEREREVLDMLASGHLSKQIARRMDVSINTVHTYIRRIYKKLHVRSRLEALAKISGRLATAQPSLSTQYSRYTGGGVEAATHEPDGIRIRQDALPALLSLGTSPASDRQLCQGLFA